MARQAARLIAAAFLALLATAAVAEGRSAERIKPTPWSQLRPEEQRILGPIADRWASMPGLQQQRLISSARKYPSLQPIQKERFDARLRSWAEMSPEQRREARETYQGLRRLPPAQQHELRERWLQRHQQGEESSEPNFDRPPPPGPTRERPPPGPTRPDYTRSR